MADQTPATASDSVEYQPADANALRLKRFNTIAWSAWILAYFVVEAELGDQTRPLPLRYPVTAILLVLVLTKIATGAYHRSNVRLGIFFAGSTLTVLAYDALRRVPAIGEANDYLYAGATFVAVYTTTAALALYFWDEAVFVDIYFRIAAFSMGIAAVTWAASSATGLGILVNVRGVPRLQGLLSEPSAWAPVIASMLILSIRMRQRLVFALTVFCGIVTASPTVLFVTGVTLPLHFLLVEARTAKKLPIAVALAFLLGTFGLFLANADARDYLGTGSQLNEVTGRMIRGIDSIQTGDTSGVNQRYTSLLRTIDEVGALERGDLGYGPDSHAAYFPARFDERGAEGRLLPNSLVAVTLFDFGRFGLIALVSLILVAMARVRGSPLAAGVLIPFIVASMVNSAQGSELYKWVALAIFVFALRWVPPRRHSAQPPDGR